MVDAYITPISLTLALRSRSGSMEGWFRLFFLRTVVFAVVDEGIPWLWTALSLLTVPALIALNGFFVAAEYSLVAVRKTRVEELVATASKAPRRWTPPCADLSRSIAGTQLGVTLSSIGLGFVGEPALAQLLDPSFRLLFGSWHGAATHTVATALAFLLITFLHVVFGELIPKALALQDPGRASLWLARPLVGFVRIARPLLQLMNGVSNFILRLLGSHPVSARKSAHSIDELILLIEDTEEAGVLDADQADFVQNVFHLSNKRVRDCMAPRDKMAVLELNAPPDKVMEAVRAGAHTRMPVYEGELDNIVGIVNTKDLFYLFSLQGVVVLHDPLSGPLSQAGRGVGQRRSDCSARADGRWHWYAMRTITSSASSRWKTCWKKSSATLRTSMTGQRPSSTEPRR